MATISFFITDDLQSRSTLASGVIAGVVIAAIPVYDIQRWSLFKRTLLHFALMLVFVLPLLLCARWFSLPVSVVVFLLCGAVGWAIGFAINKLQKK